MTAGREAELAGIPTARKEIDIQIGVTDDVSGPWYFSPLWVVIGAIISSCIVIVVAMASTISLPSDPPGASWAAWTRGRSASPLR